MRITRKGLMLGAALGVLALSGGATAALAAPTISGNVALVTDYPFRGITQSDNNFAIQGGLDLTAGIFYAGTWASSIDFSEFILPASTELDFYAGLRPTAGPFSFDLGVVGYIYPNADEGVFGYGEMDYMELYGKTFVSPASGFTLGAAVYYSPEFTLETGEAWYLEANAAWVITPMWSVSGAVGYQDIADVTGVFSSVVAPFPSEVGDSYTTWNAGISFSNWGLVFDLRYVDTDIDSSDPIIVECYASPDCASDQNVDGRAVFAIKKAL